MWDRKSKPRRPTFALARICLLIFGGIGSASATTIVPPEFPALVNGADYIVHAITRSVHAEKRTGTHGVKIVTLVELELIEVVAGIPPDRIVLEMLGGRVGDEELTVAGAPQFHAGDEDILFVSGNGRTICPLYAMTYGRYPVVTDPASGRSYMLRVGGEPLRDTRQISASLGEKYTAGGPTAQAVASGGLSPAEFIRQIRASRSTGAPANREK